MRHRAFGKLAGPGDPLGLVPGGPWVALEKIHGAQMQIALADGRLRFGKRKAWLADDEPFFGWQLIRGPLTELALALARTLGAARMVLYGELFGGAYPHPRVAAVPGLQPVQTGIWYAPDLRWALFDLLLLASGDDHDEGELLAFHELKDLSQGTCLILPPLLRSGPRPHVDATETRGATRVPQQLGLPELANNLAEGLVIRPDIRARPGARPAYKRKIAEFDEQRFRESEAWDPAQRLGRDALIAWALRLVNPARIASAASKWGLHQREVLLDEVELDVMIDIAAAFPAAHAGLSADDELALRAAIRRAAGPLLAPR